MKSPTHALPKTQFNPTLTMNDSENPLLLDHEADGIRELDNKLPRWWVWLFYATIIFSVVYLAYYHVLAAANQRTSAAEYGAEMKKGEAIKGTALAAFEQGMAGLTPSTDPQVLATGQQTFLKLCAPCHRPDGGG